MFQNAMMISPPLAGSAQSASRKFPLGNDRSGIRTAVSDQLCNTAAVMSTTEVKRLFSGFCTARAGLGVELWRDYLKFGANSYFRLSGWRDAPEQNNAYEARPANV